MIIKFFLLIIVILILFLSLRTISNFTTSVSESESESEVDPEIQKLHNILSDQSNNLQILVDDRMELQQRINTIAKEVYGNPTTTVS